MANCIDTKPVIGCFTPADTNIQPVSILIHVVYDSEGKAIGQAFSLGDANQTPIDITTYLGGGAVTVGACEIIQPEIESVCVDLGSGCKEPAFRKSSVENGVEVVEFFDESGDITASVTNWKAGSCNQQRAYIDTCFLPDQYAIQWAWNGSGRLSSYDPLTELWTDYGTTQLGGTTIGGFALAFKNDAVEPTLYFQTGGNLYKASPDDPIGTFSLVGPTLPDAPSSYPCFDFDPSGRLLAGIASGSTVVEIDPDTGAATNIGALTDARDGAVLAAAPGDWFFDPNGNWFLMARDTRGATFGQCTGTALWKIDPSTLETIRVSGTCAPSSGTGATWLAAGRSLLSTSSGLIYEYNSYTDSWTNFDNSIAHSINDLASQWVIPQPIRVFGWVDEDCPSGDCEGKLFNLVQQEDASFVCEPFEPSLSGALGQCEPAPNPFVTDPFSDSGSSGGCDRCPDEVWHEGCSDAGFTHWRVAYDAAGNATTEYLYGTLSTPVTLAPPNFSSIPCGEVQPGTENVTIFCDLDSNTTVYRKEQTLTDGTIEVEWFDETGVITEPTNLAPDSCDTNDPLLPVTEQVICLDGVQYVRVEKEVNAINADGLPELVSSQVIYFNADGTLYDSGNVPVGGTFPAGEPTDWYLGQCQLEYVGYDDVKLCEIDARYLLLIDSSENFARYSFYTEEWENVSTLSVASAGGSADVANFLLYNFVAPDQMTVIDVNTDTQLPNVTLIDGILKPGLTANPKSFSAAAFRDSNGRLYAWDTGGTDAGLYSVNVATGEVDFVTTVSGVSGTGTSIAIDNTTDTLYINGSAGRVYQVDWVTGVGTLVATAPITANGSTYDTDGNLYVSSANDTYVLPSGADGTDPANWNQIIDDWAPGANSIAYYEVVAPSPSCFFRRFGILADGSREIIGDFNVADDSPRTVVGDVDCCECSCGGGGGGGTVDGSVSIDGPVELALPTITPQDFTNYTSDIEALPVGFLNGYIPDFHVIGDIVTYYQGEGRYNGPNAADYGIDAGGDGAEVTKVWFPESAIVPTEATINIPTISVVDFDQNADDNQDEDIQNLIGAGYTKDIEALPIGVPAGDYLPVKLGLTEQEYFGGLNPDNSEITGQTTVLRVALPSSAQIKTVEQGRTLQALHIDTDVDGAVGSIPAGVQSWELSILDPNGPDPLVGLSNGVRSVPAPVGVIGSTVENDGSTINHPITYDANGNRLYIIYTILA